MNGWLAKQLDVVLGHVLSSLFYRSRELHTTNPDALVFYQRQEFSAAPERFFFCPPDPPVVAFGDVSATPWYIRERFTFTSPYEPLGDFFGRQYATYPETHVVHGQRYRPFWQSSRATLVLLHGWTEGSYRWEEHSLIPWLCRDCGCTVVALVQPYHAARKPAAASFSGEYFLSSDAIRTIEACRQAVIDVRAAFNWLLDEEASSVGITGISLGAFMTYLLLGVDARPRFAVPMLGHGDLFDGPGDSSLSKNIRRGFQAQGFDPEVLHRLSRPVTARRMQPRLCPERILPINALYDTIVTHDKAQRLFDEWKIPEVVWLKSGHFGIVHTRAFRRAFRDFVERWI